MIAVVDYGVGNLFSLSASLKKIGAPSLVTRDVDVLEQAQAVILPGVGAFGDAVKKLHETGIFDPLHSLARRGKPLLGICLGMQLLFEKSDEYGEHVGLGLIEGVVRPLEGVLSPALKIPHMGWNALTLCREDPVLKYTRPGDCVYFVHSFYATGCEGAVLASAEYEVAIPAAVRQAKVWGMQFHPEKSGDVGLNMLRAFMEEVGSC